MSETLPHDIYIRVSATNGREGDSFQSPKLQRDSCDATAAMHRLPVDEVVVALDVKGDRNAGADSELERLIAKVEAGTSGGLIVWKVSRYSRSLLVGLQNAKRIMDAGGRIIGTDLDTSAPNANTMLGLQLGLAEDEHEAKKATWRAVKSNAVANGIYCAGRIPVGYVRGEDKRLAPDPATAAAVSEAFRLRAEGRSLLDVARHFDAAIPQGPPRPNGKPNPEGYRWNTQTVSLILKNRAYLGEARNGKNVNPAAHDALTDAETFDLVAAFARLRKSEQRPPREGASALLAGVVYCHGCGHRMQLTTVGKAAAQSKGYKGFRCKNRACTAPVSYVAEGKLDAHVWSAAVERWSEVRDDVYAAGAPRDVGALRPEARPIIDSLEAERGKREVFEDADYVAALGLEAAKRALAKCDAKIRTLESELAGIADDLSPFGTPWGESIAVHVLDQCIADPGSSLEDRRSTVRAVVERVTVRRAARGAKLADRVEVELRAAPGEAVEVEVAAPHLVAVG